MAFYTVRFSDLSVGVFREYGTPAFDFGPFDQGIWLLSRFKDPFVTVMGRNLFGDHSSYILVLLAPLYWIYPHGASLLVLQSALIALGALPIYLLGRRLHLGTIMATVLAGAYLLYPSVETINLEQFHPECFLPFLLGMAIYAAFTWNRRMLVIMVVLALLVKEDVGLFIVPLGLWVAFRRDRKWGIGITLAGIAWPLLCLMVFMPTLLGYPSPSDTGHIPFGSVSGFFRTVTRTPGTFFNYLRADRRPYYLQQMFFPTGYMFVFAPEIAALALLTLASNYLSGDSYQHQAIYHYSLAPSAVLVIACVFSLAALKRRKLRILSLLGIVVSSVWACYLWGLMPFSIAQVTIVPPTNPQIAADAKVAASIPPDAVVSADTYLVAHLDHRVQVYLWPTPFSTSNYGNWSQNGKPLPIARQVQYIMVDLPQTRQNRALLASLAPQFRLVTLDLDVALYERADDVVVGHRRAHGHLPGRRELGQQTGTRSRVGFLAYDAFRNLTTSLSKRGPAWRW